MRKTIYYAKTEPSAWFGNSFPEYILCVKGVERIMAGECGLQQTFFFHKQSVAMDYHYRLAGETTVVLFGEEGKVGEVEKIVLEAAQQS